MAQAPPELVFPLLFVSFVIVLALTFIVWIIIKGGKKKGQRRFWDIIRADDWYPSLSIFQFMLWTFVVIFAYLGVYLIRMSGGIFTPISNIPTNLLTLMGISITVPVVSGGVSDIKYKESATQTPPKPMPAFSEMLSEGGKPTLTRFQMFCWTWIGIGIYLIIFLTTVTKPANLQAVENLSLPDIDQSLVFLMGLSQGAYVGGKIVTTQIMKVTSILPNTAKAKAGSVISIFGANFGTTADTVWFNDTSHLVNVTSGGSEHWTDTRIDVAVPSNLPPGKYDVKVAVGGNLTESAGSNGSLTIT